MLILITKLIEQLPYILVGLAALVSAAAYLVSIRAKNNPEKTWEDDWAPTLNNAKDGLIQAIEWLGKTKGWSGQQKLEQLLRQTNELEILWSAGKKTEALMRAAAFYFDAQGKAQAAGLLTEKKDGLVPFVSSPASK